jgi:HEAT repeat protein
MTKRIFLLVAVAWATSLVFAVGSARATADQPQEPPATNYAALSPAIRLLTIEAQGPGTPGAIPALEQLLWDKSRVINVQAGQVLASWAATGDANIVMPALAHKDPLVRGIAQATYIQTNAYNLAPLVIDGAVIEVPPAVLAALADFRDPSGLVDFKLILDADRDNLRKQMESTAEEAVLVADILARVGDAGARRVLINLVRATDSIILAKAARACVRDDMLLGPTLLPIAFRNDEVARRSVMMALVAHPDPMLKSLVARGLHDSDGAVRRNAIRALANMGGAAPIDLMAAELNKVTASRATGTAGAVPEQTELIRALGVVGKPAAGVLRDYLKKYPNLNDAQVSALLAFGPSASADDIPWIAKRLESQDKYVRAAAAAALGKTLHPAAQTALISQAKDPDPLVRASVAKALGQISTIYASMELVRMLDDPSPLVSSMAAWGLGTATYPDAIPALRAIVKSRVSVDPTPTRFGEVYGWPDLAAVEALGRIHGTDAAPFLCQQLRSPSWAMRATAAQALGAAGDTSAPTIAALENALRDSVPLVKATALLSLKTLGKTYTGDQLLLITRKAASR